MLRCACVFWVAGLSAACSPTNQLLPDGGGAEAGIDVQQVVADQLRLDSQPAPKWSKCDESGWFSGYPKPGAEVQCATLKVPFDASKPGGPTFDLRVARQKATSPGSTPRAIVHIAGGPGVSSIAMASALPHYLPGLLADFDQLYVDLRGTGFSDGLVCPGGSPESKADWEACAVAQGTRDLNHYLTLDAANDLEQVRKRLGYDKLILDGGSYGSRVVLEYMRQYPQQLAMAVMMSMAPPDWTIFSWAIQGTGKAVDGLVIRCNKDPACKAVCPDLAADLAARRQALADKPRKVLVNGKTMLEDEATFVALLGLAIDKPSTYFKIPRAVHDAVSGDNTAWNGIMSTVIGGSVKDASNLPKPPPEMPRLRLSKGQRWLPLGPDLMAEGLHGTVLCAEWLPNEPGVAELKALESKQTWPGPPMSELAEACASWKVTPIAASLRAPVTSSVKALLLSGELDLRTPVSSGEHTAATLTNATHLVVPYAGHADEIVTSSCVGQIMTDFIKAGGDMKTVSTACLGSLKQPAW